MLLPNLLSRRRILSLAGVMLVPGCASLPPPSSSNRSASVDAQPAPTEATPRNTPADSQRLTVVATALAQLGSPYRSGGRSPATGFDCSGLASHAYASAGVRLVGAARDMVQSTRVISPDDLRPADLVFFNTTGAPYSHVAIYLGDGMLVHALNRRTGVRRDALKSPYYWQRMTACRSVFA